MDKHGAARAARGNDFLRGLVEALQTHKSELEAQNNELRETQVELEAAQDQYRQLYDEAPVGYVTTDHRSCILNANRTATELLRAVEGELRGKALASFMEESSADLLHLHIEMVLTSSGAQVCELDLVDESAKRKTVRLHSRALARHVCSVTPTNPQLLIVLEDITEEQESAAKLERSEPRFRQLAEVIEDIFYVRSLTGSIVYVSPALERITGHSPSDLCEGQVTWLQLVIPEDRMRVEQSLAAGVKGDPIDLQYRVRRPDGNLCWIHDRAFAVEDESGSPLHHVGIARDITNEKQLENELRQAQKMEAIGTLSSGIAHDFRNLLQGIVGCATLALRPGSDPVAIRRNLVNIVNAAKRGTALTDQLSTFGYKRSAVHEALPIDAALRELAPFLERLTDDHVSVVLELNAPGCAIRADRAQIEQILLNLASNAADAMPHGGRLTIGTDVVPLSEVRNPPDLAEGEHALLLRVSDVGVGMSEETRTRMFEPFFTTKDIGKGTGLGLSSVFATTRRLGGSVDVETTLDRGTRFSFFLPCTSVEVPTDGSAVQQIPRLTGSVLLVEDDPTVRLVLEQYLLQAGLSVVAVANAQAALEHCQAARIDVVVSDVMMPNMTGPALIERLHQLDGELPVLYLSAHSSSDLRAKGIIHGTEKILQKPVDAPQLVQAVAEILPPARLARCISDRGSVDPTTARVLVVEDCALTRLMLQELLRSAGYSVQSFEHPQQAQLAMDGSERIDLLVTDVSLPGTSGTKLARNLRESCPGLPVLFLSGVSEPPAITDSAFLRKPVDVDAVLASVQQLLSPVRPAAFA
jgi:PAS domain S-box-containing protein